MVVVEYRKNPLEGAEESLKNLKSLYSYMFSQLIEANMEKKPEPVLNVVDLLKELRGAWLQIREKKKPEEKKWNSSGEDIKQNHQVDTEKRIKITG